MSKIAWNDVDWTLVQKRTSRQQKRVYKASKDGNKIVVQALQRRIIGSFDAKLLAVRQVTIENRRFNIPGINDEKTISHNKKIELAYHLKIDGNVSYIKTTYIPKSGKSKCPSLGILPVEDYAKQMLAKFALEPEWEAIFESNSYGFRPGRSCHDAISTLFLSLRRKSRYILDINIQKCFDKINHNKLLNKLLTFGQMKRQLKTWLKSGILTSYSERADEVFKSMRHTSQSEIISSLLANIALQGLENHIKDWYTNEWYPMIEGSFQITKRDPESTIGFSKYADDFVITAPIYEDTIQTQFETAKWLDNEVGLQLSSAKINVVNSTEGFEFLGFQVVSIKTQDNRMFEVKIHPSKTSKAKIVLRIRKLIQKNKSASSYSLIKRLSGQIIKWANYFCYSECRQDFSKIDYLIFNQVRAWVFRRKSKRLHARTKLKLKYFPESNIYRFRGKDYKNNWILTGKILIESEMKENFLPKLLWVQSRQYVKIKGNASPYEGNHIYWAKRTEQDFGFNRNIFKTIRTQTSCCN